MLWSKKSILITVAAFRNTKASTIPNAMPILVCANQEHLGIILLWNVSFALKDFMLIATILAVSNALQIVQPVHQQQIAVHAILAFI